TRLALDGARPRATPRHHPQERPYDAHQHAAVRCSRSGAAAPSSRQLSLRPEWRTGAGCRRRRDLVRGVVASRARDQRSTRGSDGARRIRRAAGSVVAVRHRDPGARDRMGAAPAPGTPVMGGAGGLWKKIGRFFTGDATGLETVQRLLVEADFGVAATNETVERLSRADN